jgi:hypothetical protein
VYKNVIQSIKTLVTAAGLMGIHFQEPRNGVGYQRVCRKAGIPLKAPKRLTSPPPSLTLIGLRAACHAVYHCRHNVPTYTRNR